jgi:hypothetical protein
VRDAKSTDKGVRVKLRLSSADGLLMMGFCAEKLLLLQFLRKISPATAENKRQFFEKLPLHRPRFVSNGRGRGTVLFLIAGKLDFTKINPHAL